MPSSVIIHQIEMPATVKELGAERVMRPIVIMVDEALLGKALARDSAAATTIMTDLLTAVKAEHAANWTDMRRR